MTRRVVITADDLGRDPGTTEVIASLLAEGHLTATTLITVSPAAEQAADRMRDLGVVPHLHVTLTGDGRLPRWRPLSGAASLVDPDGTLTDDPYALGRRGEAADVVAELEAQLAWMRSRGLPAEAADSHAGALYGLYGRSWLAEAIEWCARSNLAFRLPREPESYWGGPLPAHLANAHGRAVELADTLGVPLPRTIATNRSTAGDVGSYERLRGQYLDRLGALPEGTSELILHPSLGIPGPSGVLREWEARLLRDPVWHKAIQTEGVEAVARWWR